MEVYPLNEALEDHHIGNRHESSINVPFSIAMLNHQMVSWGKYEHILKDKWLWIFLAIKIW